MIATVGAVILHQWSCTGTTATVGEYLKLLAKIPGMAVCKYIRRELAFLRLLRKANGLPADN